MNHLERTLAENKALSAMIDALTPHGCEQAVDQVRALWTGEVPEDPDDRVIFVAWARILGISVEVPIIPSGDDTARHLFARTARAWMLWAIGEGTKAKVALETIPEDRGREGGEIHLMALGPWCHGVGALIRGDREEALRYFRRSTEIGSQLGTETNYVIQWTFAATFCVQEPSPGVTS